MTTSPTPDIGQTIKFKNFGDVEWRTGEVVNLTPLLQVIADDTCNLNTVKEWETNGKTTK